jgi:hypothetical protein
MWVPEKKLWALGGVGALIVGEDRRGTVSVGGAAIFAEEF